MKKIIAFILSVVLSFGIIPAFATVADAIIYANVSIDHETKIVNVSGLVIGGGEYITSYLLFPGKTVQDIAIDSPENRVVSNIEQLKVSSEGTFSYRFKYSGKPGEYTLCLKSGKEYAQCIVDTTKSTSIVSTVECLKNLDTEYKPLTGETVKDRFMQAKDEIGEEVPVVLPTVPVGYREVYVSTDGDDVYGDGSIENPYSTVEKAVQDIENLSGVAVYLRGGVYPYSAIGSISGKIQNEDFPLYISAYPGENVTVTGGDAIAFDKFTKAHDKKAKEKLAPMVRDSIVSVDLSELGIDYGGSFSVESRPILYADNKQYEIARWPNGSMTNMRQYDGADGENGVVDSGSVTTGIGSSAGEPRDTGKYGEKGFEFSVEEIRPFTWENTGNIWMYGSFYAEWTKDHVKVKSLNPDRRSIRTENGISWGSVYDKGNGFYYYNIFEELDSPGEWFFDEETNLLYIYPDSDLSGKYITLSTYSAPMVNIANCKNIIINGITFEKITDDAILISDSEGVVIQNCTVDGCGGNAVNISGNSRYSGVTTSKIQNAKGDAFNSAMTKEIKTNFTPQRNFFQNSYVYNSKAVRSSGIGNIVSHNVVSNSVGSALYIMGTENIYEYNEILGSPRVIKDAGAIYIAGSEDTRRGNHVRYNYIHDSGTENVINGVYLDGKSSGNYVYGNIMEGARVFIHGGSENSIYNNMIFDILDEQGIHDSLNFFRDQDRWILSALEYGSATSYLKRGYPDISKDPWKGRYPSLWEEAEKMKIRIKEYEADNNSFPSKINVNFYTGEIVDGTVVYDTDNQWEYAYSPKYDGRFDSTNKITDLDTYLRAPKKLHIENNLLVNVPQNIFIYPLSKRTSEIKNNYRLENYQNPFMNNDYSTLSAYETIRSYIPEFENINFEKIGVIVDENTWQEYMALGKANAISPAEGLEIHMLNKEINLIWSSVPGATEYTVEIAKDSEFNEIICSETSGELNYTVNADETTIQDDTEYFWRVICKTFSKDITGDITVSDTFTFVTRFYDDSAQSVYNKVGITAIEKSEENGVVTLNYMLFNAAQKNVETNIYAAIYDIGENLVSAEEVPKELTANDFAEKMNIELDDKMSKIKFFIWSTDSGLIPYSKVIEVELK